MVPPRGMCGGRGGWLELVLVDVAGPPLGRRRAVISSGPSTGGSASLALGGPSPGPLGYPEGPSRLTHRFPVGGQEGRQVLLGDPDQPAEFHHRDPSLEHGSPPPPQRRGSPICAFLEGEQPRHRAASSSSSSA